jgi:hypothetical protein
VGPPLTKANLNDPVTGHLRQHFTTLLLDQTVGEALDWLCSQPPPGPEFCATTVVCLGLGRSGWGRVDFWVAWLSLGMYPINVLLMDLTWGLGYRCAAGDTSGL